MQLKDMIHWFYCGIAASGWFFFWDASKPISTRRTSHWMPSASASKLGPCSLQSINRTQRYMDASVASSDVYLASGHACHSTAGTQSVTNVAIGSALHTFLGPGLQPWQSTLYVQWLLLIALYWPCLLVLASQRRRSSESIAVQEFADCSKTLHHENKCTVDLRPITSTACQAAP